jgi:hypothetical protein
MFPVSERRLVVLDMSPMQRVKLGVVVDRAKQCDFLRCTSFPYANLDWAKFSDEGSPSARSNSQKPRIVDGSKETIP